MAAPSDLFGIAVQHHQAGALARAEALYRQILQADPGHRDAWINLAMALRAMGRREEAVACFAEVARLFPESAEAHGNLGNALGEVGRLDEAIRAYEEALRLNPRLASEHNNLGLALRQRGRLAEAAAHFQQALEIEPGYANAHYNLANTLRDQGDLERAAHGYRQALALDPRRANAHQNLGTIWMSQGELEQAAACYREALRLEPRHADAHSNLGVLLCKQGVLDQSVMHLDQAVRLNPSHAGARFNRSLLRLLQGDFEGGWPDYEWRPREPRGFAQPLWQGEPLTGKTILLHCEQGLGDTVQFIRYAPLVKGQGGTVLVECQPAVVGLLQSVVEIDQIVPRGQVLPAFDMQAPLLSLPGIVRTSVATIPANVPYLRAAPACIQRWQQDWRASQGALRIGIAWRGNPSNTDDRYRSTSLAQFELLARLEGVRLFSLQVGPGVEELAAASFSVMDLGSRFDTSALDDLAAAIMGMDLVVSVDSLVAHLAGALGRAAWTLLAAAADWRWLRARADSPWYPTMRLFRQARAGHWTDVLTRVAAEVQALAARGASGATAPCQ